MEHERGAFKVIRRICLAQLRNGPEIRCLLRLVFALARSGCHRSDKMSCQKIRQMAYFA